MQWPALPDGDYEARDPARRRRGHQEPVGVKGQLRIRGAAAEIDFSGTDPQTRRRSRPAGGGRPRRDRREGRARSAPSDERRCDAAVPALVPPGSVVLALPPTSQSNHVETGAKVARLMTRRHVQGGSPSRRWLTTAGTSGAMIAGGIDTRPGFEGLPFGSAFVFGEAWGGTEKSDGISVLPSLALQLPRGDRRVRREGDADRHLGARAHDRHEPARAAIAAGSGRRTRSRRCPTVLHADRRRSSKFRRARARRRRGRHDVVRRPGQKGRERRHREPGTGSCRPSG